MDASSNRVRVTDAVERWRRSDGFVHRYGDEIRRGGVDITALAIHDVTEAIIAELDAIPNRAATRIPSRVSPARRCAAAQQAERGGWRDRPPMAPPAPERGASKPIGHKHTHDHEPDEPCGYSCPPGRATPNRAADYPEDLRWRQHVEDEIVCLQEAVADLQRRMAT